jgi:hypothetical protein
MMQATDGRGVATDGEEENWPQMEKKKISHRWTQMNADKKDV